jgi:Arm DNA-binding domain
MKNSTTELKRRPLKGNFTDKYIDNLKREPKMYQVRECRGFAIRVLTTGVKSWYFIYTINGKRRQICLGNYPDVSLKEARKNYKRAFDLTEVGIDPLQKQATPEPPPTPPPVLTVAGLVDLYIERTKTYLVPRSVRQQSRTLTQDVIPVIGDRPVSEIRRKDAIHLVETIAKRAPGQARNVIKTARAMFTYAHDYELVEVNPFSNIGRAVPSTAPKSRDRTLLNSEIKHIWGVLSNSEIGRTILMVLVTAQRPGEVSGMAWNEIVIGEEKPRCFICRRCGWWTIPSRFCRLRMTIMSIPPMVAAVVKEQPVECDRQPCHTLFQITNILDCHGGHRMI